MPSGEAELYTDTIGTVEGKIQEKRLIGQTGAPPRFLLRLGTLVARMKVRMAR
jgi:hypothetical protein